LLGVEYLQARLAAFVESLGFGESLVVPIPQLPSHRNEYGGTAELVQRLIRRLWLLEYGGDWRIWRTHLALLFFMRKKQPLVLTDATFAAFTRLHAYLRLPAAVRQWKLLSQELTLEDPDTGRAFRVMEGDSLLRPYSYAYAPCVVHDRPSDLFPVDSFDPGNPPTELVGDVHPTYACMVAFALVALFSRSSINQSEHRRYSCSFRPSSPCSRKVRALLKTQSSEDAASDGHTESTQTHVYDKKRRHHDHHRLIPLTSGVEGGHVAVMHLCEWATGRASSCSVTICTTEGLPSEGTREATRRLLGEDIETRVWRAHYQR